MPGQEKEKITVTATLELSHRDRQAISFAAEKLPFPANHAAISAFAEWASHKVLPTVVHLLNKAEAEGEDLPKALLRSAEEDDYERDDPDCPADFDYVDTMANAYLELAAKLDDRQLQELLLYAAKQMGIPLLPGRTNGPTGSRSQRSVARFEGLPCQAICGGVPCP